MVRTTPHCPDCGSRYLVMKFNTPARMYRREQQYRCWRCFSTFGKSDVADGGGDTERNLAERNLAERNPAERNLADGKGGDGPSDAPAGPQGDLSAEAEIAAIRVDLEPEGTKWRVEQFDVVVRNRGTEPLRVDRAFLTFDGDERTSVPREDVVAAPGDAETLAIHRSWIHGDQDVATVELRSGSALVATADVDLRAHREDRSAED